MTLQKAIEILNHKVSQNVFQVDPDALTALKLGKEALNKIHQLRRGSVYSPILKLPSETKE